MLRKESRRDANKFLNDLSKLVVKYMYQHNIPAFAIFRENIIDSIPKSDKVYDLIKFGYVKDGKNWYESNKCVLPTFDAMNNLNYGDKISFNYDAVKYKIFMYHITYKILWYID